MPLRFLTLALMAGLAAPMAANGVPCSLDSLLNAPHSWKISTTEFEKTFTLGNRKLYRWLTADKTRAKLATNVIPGTRVELTAFDGKVQAQEVIADFAEGKLNLVSVSFYNRGDNGTISAEVLKKRVTVIRNVMTEQLKTHPRQRTAKPSNGLLTEGYSWNSNQIATALLEHNEGALSGGRQEFLRLRIARPGAKGMLAASLKHERGGAAVRLGQLAQNVVKSHNGDIYVANLPMVDQGQKGYCVSATVQRLFEYYGIGADMHQIAEIAGSDPRRGTNTITMAAELDKIDYRFKTRLDILGMGMPMVEVDKRKGEYYVGDPYEERDFTKAVYKYVDDGLPLLWSLQLGRYPEKPNLNPQTSGGHMRMIIGYNKKTEEILFSDSWGAGHELKRMRMDHAYKATHGLFVLTPTVR